MWYRSVSILVGLIVAWDTVAAPPPQSELRSVPGNLVAGDAAPDFTVQDIDGKKTVKLADLAGKPAVLIFGSCT